MFGLEAELAVAAVARESGEAVATEHVAGALFHEAVRASPHLRAHESGLYLATGGLFLIDAGNHPEIATPEVCSPNEAVAYLRAGEAWLCRLARACGERLQWNIHVLGTNVDCRDPSCAVTWGAHESYAVRHPPADYASCLLPHLASRIVYTGSGGLDPRYPGIRFSLSPRVHFFETDRSEITTADRGLFNLRQESLSTRSYRLHVIPGCNARSEIATYLRVGTTALIARAADAGIEFGLTLADPVAAVTTIALDPTCTAAVAVRQPDPRSLSAVAIQRRYLQTIEAWLSFFPQRLPSWAPEVCRLWRRVLDQLEADPCAMAACLDWPLKRALFAERITQLGWSWAKIAAANEALDVLYEAARRLGHRLSPPDEATIALLGRFPEFQPAIDRGSGILERHRLRWRDLTNLNRLRAELCALDVRIAQLGEGIFAKLDRGGLLAHRVTTDAEIERAMTLPPRNGRARIRGEWIARLDPYRDHYRAHWTGIQGADGWFLDLRDPWCAEGRWRRAASARSESGTRDRA